MEKKVTETTTVKLSQADIQRAIIQYVTAHQGVSFDINDVTLDAEMSDPDTVGRVTAVCKKTEESE